MKPFLIVALSIGLHCTAIAQALFHSEITKQALESGSMFPFGVASGDPRQDKVVLWTKVFSTVNKSQFNVKWSIAIDTTMNNIVDSGFVMADQSTAFTVHVEAQKLLPGVTYFYQFEVDGKFSPIGRTRTAPENPESLRFAVVSCADYQSGYFNAFALIAARKDLDAVVHLGDYIYESGARASAMRAHIPPHEIVNLNDYRSRYAQYRLDADLAEAHRLHPFILIWDDHEFVNNSFKNGADNHDENEGDWEERQSIARQVYFEWMPVMNPEQKTIIRKFNYGGLADLFMLDGRLEGRAQPIADFRDPRLNLPEQTMLGNAQTDWLTEGLLNSNAKWKVIGNPVMFSAMDFTKFAKNRQRNMDGWDGFPSNRDHIFEKLESKHIKNVVVITGDIHTSWAMDLTRNPMDKAIYNRRTGKGVVGAEFITPSISSRNLDEMQGKFVASLAESVTKSPKRNPHLRYVNLTDHGYMLLDLTGQESKATWIYCKTLKVKSLKVKPMKSYGFLLNGKHLVKERP
jgi:alkaline phosphatase D